MNKENSSYWTQEEVSQKRQGVSILAGQGHHGPWTFLQYSYHTVWINVICSYSPVSGSLNEDYLGSIYIKIK